MKGVSRKEWILLAALLLWLVSCIILVMAGTAKAQDIIEPLMTQWVDHGDGCVMEAQTRGGLLIHYALACDGWVQAEDEAHNTKDLRSIYWFRYRLARVWVMMGHGKLQWARTLREWAY